MFKYFFHVVAVACLLALPSIVYSQSAEEGPPVSQPIVSQGDFAEELVSALHLGDADSEDQAQEILRSAGIAPRRGWNRDDPVTPLVIGEVRDSIVAAADSGSISLSRDEALKAFRNVTAENDLDIYPLSGENPEEYPPAADYDDHPDIVNNYYYEQGPPAITYYPPPAEYGGLYSWYSYPFYGYGTYFPGFWALSDFGFYNGGFYGHNRGRFGRRWRDDRHAFNDRFGGSRFNRFDRFNRFNRFNRFDNRRGFLRFRDFGRGAASARIWNNQSPTQNRIWSNRFGSSHSGFNRPGFNAGRFGGGFGGMRTFSITQGQMGGFRGGSSFRGGFGGGGGFGGRGMGGRGGMGGGARGGFAGGHR